jgi:hypothetical protein
MGIYVKKNNVKAVVYYEVANGSLNTNGKIKESNLITNKYEPNQ